MSLDFCCDIQMVGSEFAVKNMKAYIHPGGVMVWGIFSWHTLGPLVPIEHCLNTTAYLSIVADHIHPFMTTVYPSSDDFFQQENAPSQSSNHLRLVSWTWQWVHFTQMSSTVTRSQSNRALLGCGGTGDAFYWIRSWISCFKWPFLNTLRKKGTKAVTGAVSFQKGHLCS